jgi:hypothetical protein
MLVIDPTRTWRKVEERLKRETHPVLRRNLETLLAHMKAEAHADLDGLMRTVAEDAHYHAYGSEDQAWLNPKGKPAVRRFYQDFVASGAVRLMFDVDRLVVDTDCVVTEGVMRMAYPGKTLALMGKAIDDPDAFYLFETRMCVLWPMDRDGLVLGEDSYTGGDGFVGIEGRKLSERDIGSLPAA